MNRPVASEPTLIIYRPELVGGNDRLAYLRAFHAASGSRFLEADVEYSSSFSVTSSDSQSISACYAPFADSFAFVTSGGVYAIDNLKRIESQSLANFKRPLGLEDGVDLAVVSDTQSLYFYARNLPGRFTHLYAFTANLQRDSAKDVILERPDGTFNKITRVGYCEAVAMWLAMVDDQDKAIIYSYRHTATSIENNVSRSFTNSKDDAKYDMWIGTSAEYGAISQRSSRTLYFTT